MTKIAVLGSGVVGQVLADGFLAHGYEVMRGTRDPKKLADWKEGAGGKASVGTFSQAARHGDIVVLAVKGTAAEDAVEQAGPAHLAGKTVIDATNPIADEPPEHGVLKFFTNLSESLMERLQKRAPGAHFVKAFSCTGNANMVNPDFGGAKPTMFICGDDAGARALAAKLSGELGWNAEDVGPAGMGHALEALCQIWCAPGFQRNDWAHAFAFLRP